MSKILEGVSAVAQNVEIFQVRAVTIAAGQSAGSIATEKGGVSE